MKITIDRATVEQALEALESGVWYINQLEQIVYSADDAGTHEERAKVQAAITALRAELAQQAEPVPPFPPISQWKLGCAVCGIGADGNAYGYVCPRSDCPTKVTCGGVA